MTATAPPCLRSVISDVRNALRDADVKRAHADHHLSRGRPEAARAATLEAEELERAALTRVIRLARTPMGIEDVT